jgi:TPR repeat protein
MATAQFDSGVRLARGEGVSMNIIESARYLRLAAAQGLLAAQSACGFCLTTGRGVSMNLNEPGDIFDLLQNREIPLLSSIMDIALRQVEVFRRF